MQGLVDFAGEIVRQRFPIKRASGQVQIEGVLSLRQLVARVEIAKHRQTGHSLKALAEGHCAERVCAQGRVRRIHVARRKTQSEQVQQTVGESSGAKDKNS